MDIFDVRIDNLTKDEIILKIKGYLNEPKFHQIATVNAEFILQAQKDNDFKNILNTCDLNVADTISIRYAFLRYGKWLKARIAGADLMHEILKIANEKKLSVFLAVSKNGLSSYGEIKNKLLQLYPNVSFSGADIDNQNFFSYQMPNAMCHILFCNFGAPRQEKFINCVKNDILGVAMGIGGSFDYITGKIKRAPKIMRYFGLEWLWRLILQPKRWKRIWNAVIIFPIRIIFNK